MTPSTRPSVEHAARERVQEELDARLVQQLERDQLERFGIERDDIAGRERRRDGAALRHETLEELPEDAGHHGFARTMIGRQQRRRTGLFGDLLLRVERHQRHHQCRCRVAAEEAVPLGEDDARARFCGAESRAQSRGPAADDEHVGLAGDDRSPRGKGALRGTRRSRQRGHVQDIYVRVATLPSSTAVRCVSNSRAMRWVSCARAFSAGSIAAMCARSASLRSQHSSR